MIVLSVAVVLAIAAWYDFWFMRIPNWLQIVGLCTVITTVNISEPETWSTRLIFGMCVTSLYLLGYAFKKIGGGDVKLMVWFATGLGADALGVLSIGILVMACYSLCMRKRLVPVAPFLLIGLLIWIGGLSSFLFHQSI